MSNAINMDVVEQLKAKQINEDTIFAAEVGKPGTNFKQISPDHLKKLNPLVEHYRKSAHPFAECKRDNTKRFGEEGANRVCSVVKDVIEGNTHWRKGPKKVSASVEEIAAAGRHFSESMVKRANDGKFAEKAGTGLNPGKAKPKKRAPKLNTSDRNQVQGNADTSGLDKQAKSTYRRHVRNGKSPAEALKHAQASHDKRNSSKADSPADRLGPKSRAAQLREKAQSERTVTIDTVRKAKSAAPARKPISNPNAAKMTADDKIEAYTRMHGRPPSAAAIAKLRKADAPKKKPGKPAKMPQSAIDRNNAERKTDSQGRGKGGVLTDSDKNLLPNPHQRAAYRRYLRKGLSSAEALKKARAV